MSKPRLVISKCLGIEACRYNGAIISDAFVDRLTPHVNLIPICPEVEIGLGVPRDPIRIVLDKGERHLFQPNTGKDLTSEMAAYTYRTLGKLSDADGFLLKNHSPSCGFMDVKIYAGKEKNGIVGKGGGFFGSEVLSQFSGSAVEDEGRLKNFRIREHFLTKLFANAALREAGESGKISQLINFQSMYKLVMMAYNQTVMRKLGKLTANSDKKPFGVVFSEYKEVFSGVFARQASRGAHINVLMHAFGYFSEELNKNEKVEFLHLLERYRSEKIPLSAVLSVLKIWMARTDQPYLASQAYFNPYPEELVELGDSGKGRDLR